MDGTDSYFTSLPKRLEPTFVVGKPNAPIAIYNGPVAITYEDKSSKCDVEITFRWFPKKGVEFVIENNRPDVFQLFLRQMKTPTLLSFQIDDFEIGQILPTHLNTKDDIFTITGLINPPVVWKKMSSAELKADHIKFHLFNFVKIFGEGVRTSNIGHSSSLARLSFPTDRHVIHVDCILRDGPEWAEISQYGGYGLTHVGEIQPLGKETINRNEFTTIMDDFGLFLSFLAGRQIAPFFVTGQNGDEKLWIEYNNHNQAPYTYYDCWLPQQFNEHIGGLWGKFYQFCENPYDRSTLQLVIHWYLSANRHSGGLEGAIILLQNAFELLFRWIVVEQKKMASTEGGDTLRASDKIRMLLYVINCATDLPTHYQQQFEDLIKKDPSLTDFPYLFTEIRNSYVHSGRKKREKIDRLPPAYLYAILTCGLYYVELLLLYLLNYEGSIAQRISTIKYHRGNEVVVPWVGE